MYNLADYQEQMARCSHCGYCQATCPSYQGTLLEANVARARMDLIRACLLDEEMPLSDRGIELIMNCLLCTNCVRTCAAQLPVDEIITAARIKMHEQKQIGQFSNKVLFKLFNQRGVAGILAKAGSFAQRLNLAPKDIPPLAERTFDKHYQGHIKTSAEKRGTVAYYIGCGTHFFYPDTGRDVVKVLTANGYDVIIPPGLSCCGIPALADGDLASAQAAVRQNIGILAGISDLDAIITDCTSCGLMFKKKMHLLLAEDDPLQADLAAINGKLFEITDFLAQDNITAALQEVAATVTYHVPCHHGWSPTVADAPRKLFAMIPGLQLQEMEEPTACCGAAGTFYMNQRDLSSNIRSPKITAIEETGAGTLVTQCPMCRYFLGDPFPQLETIHPITLLARALN